MIHQKHQVSAREKDRIENIKKKKRANAKKLIDNTLPAMSRRIVRVTDGASCGKPLLSTVAIVQVKRLSFW